MDTFLPKYIKKYNQMDFDPKIKHSLKAIFRELFNFPSYDTVYLKANSVFEFKLSSHKVCLFLHSKIFQAGNFSYLIDKKSLNDLVSLNKKETAE